MMQVDSNCHFICLKLGICYRSSMGASLEEYVFSVGSEKECEYDYPGWESHRSYSRPEPEIWSIT